MSNHNNSSQLWKTIRSFIPKKSASLRSFSKDDRTVANHFYRFFTSFGQVTFHKINSLANKCNLDLSALVLDPRIFPLTDRFNIVTKLFRSSGQWQQIRPLGLKKFWYVQSKIAFMLPFR